MRRFIGPILLVILLLGVGAGIFFSVREQISARKMISVRGLTGSEKEEFFKDPEVIEAFRKAGLEVSIEKAGSRQIATSFDLSQYDFAFPAGVPAAEKIRREVGVSKSYDVFYSPMAIATWRSIAEILVANGIALDRGGYYTLNMEKYLEFFKNGTRWIDLQENAAYPVNKSVLIASTDIRKSNSAAMYLALSSYIANGNSVVQNQSQAVQIMPLMSDLFLKQGYTEYSSEAPFNDYLVMGMGKAPMVMIYEAQFLYQASSEGGITPDMVLMYPEPTIFSKHILVPLSEGGEKLGELLVSDPELRRLAVKHGFRNNEIQVLRDLLARSGIKAPESIVNAIESPSYEILEGMIQQIEKLYQ